MTSGHSNMHMYLLTNKSTFNTLNAEATGRQQFLEVDCCHMPRINKMRTSIT